MELIPIGQTVIRTKDGCSTNGTIRYLIRSIQEAVNHHHGQQFQQLEASAKQSRARASYHSAASIKGNFLHYDGTPESVSRSLEVSRPDVVYRLATYYTGIHGLEQMPRLVNSNITLDAYLLEAMADCSCSALTDAGSHAGEGLKRFITK